MLSLYLPLIVVLLLLLLLLVLRHQVGGHLFLLKGGQQVLVDHLLRLRLLVVQVLEVVFVNDLVGDVDASLLFLGDALHLVGGGHLGVVGLHVLPQVGNVEVVAVQLADLSNLAVAHLVLVEDLLDQLAGHLVHVVDLGVDVHHVVELGHGGLHLALLHGGHVGLHVQLLVGGGVLLFLGRKTSDELLVVQVLARGEVALVVRVGVGLKDLGGGALLLLGGVDVAQHAEALHGLGAFVGGTAEVLLAGVAIKDLALEVVEEVDVDVNLVVHDDTVDLSLASWLGETALVVVEGVGEAGLEAVIDQALHVGHHAVLHALAGRQGGQAQGLLQLLIGRDQVGDGQALPEDSGLFGGQGGVGLHQEGQHQVGVGVGGLSFVLLVLDVLVVSHHVSQHLLALAAVVLALVLGGVLLVVDQDLQGVGHGRVEEMLGVVLELNPPGTHEVAFCVEVVEVEEVAEVADEVTVIGALEGLGGGVSLVVGVGLDLVGGGQHLVVDDVNRRLEAFPTLASPLVLLLVGPVIEPILQPEPLLVSHRHLDGETHFVLPLDVHHHLVDDGLAEEGEAAAQLFIPEGVHVVADLPLGVGLVVVGDGEAGELALEGLAGDLDQMHLTHDLAQGGQAVPDLDHVLLGDHLVQPDHVLQTVEGLVLGLVHVQAVLVDGQHLLAQETVLPLDAIAQQTEKEHLGDHPLVLGQESGVEHNLLRILHRLGTHVDYLGVAPVHGEGVDRQAPLLALAHLVEQVLLRLLAMSAPPLLHAPSQHRQAQQHQKHDALHLYLINYYTLAFESN